MRFNGILRGKKSEPLDTWIDEAIDSDLIPIMRFARVLRRDINAVKSAIELPWSNGQAERQINRLKTLKRAMYGRAGHELLKARMLPPLHTRGKTQLNAKRHVFPSIDHHDGFWPFNRHSLIAAMSQARDGPACLVAARGRQIARSALVADRATVSCRSR